MPQLDVELQSRAPQWKPRLPALAGAEAPQGIPRLIWEVLAARGIDSAESIEKWLKPSLKSLRDPFTLTDMDRAIGRLVQALESGERVCIYADYDLDGTSGLALLKKGLELCGFKNIAYYQPRRLSEGYGVHEEAVRRLRQDGVTLMVTVDVGITATHEVAVAREIGMDVIITDHHLPKEKLPEAYAVINPNRGNCGSQLGHLCGTGVAFYLVLALRRALLERDLLAADFDPKTLLDCYVIGTLTDMVPLVDENRVLVKHGLLALAQTARPGLRALMQALELWGKPLTSQDVAIRFAPKLNALSRMEMGIQPLDLYLATDEKQAQALVDQVLMNNQNRVVSQKSAEAEARAWLGANPPKNVAWVWSPNFHRGVVGLVATRICQDYGLPAFVGACGEDGQIVGSARIPEGSGLSALDAMEAASGALTQFGGHAVAAGFELSKERAEDFRAALEGYFSERTLASGPKCWLYDAEASLNDLNPTFMGWYEHLSPFGAQFAPPVFLLKSAKVAAVKSLRGGHFRLTFTQENAVSRVALWFSPPQSHVLAEDLRPGLRVDALVEPQWNYYAGSRTLQLLVQDIRPSL